MGDPRVQQFLKKPLRYIIQTANFIYQLASSEKHRPYLIPWVSSLTPNYLLRVKKPWITYGAMSLLEQMTEINGKVFEFGSGASTLFWLKRGYDCVSIEHDKTWYSILQTKIPRNARIDYRLVEPQIPAEPITASPALPEAYTSGVPDYKGLDFRSYVQQIDEFADQTFDIILIDGRARSSCFKHSINKVRIGGMIVLDNAERPYYTQQLRHELTQFRELRFVGPSPLYPRMSQTSVFIRLV